MLQGIDSHQNMKKSKNITAKIPTSEKKRQTHTLRKYFLSPELISWP